MNNFYQFPATRFVSNSLWRQWWHLLSVVIGAGWALLGGNLQYVATTVWIVKRNSETLHRILSGKGVDVEMAKESLCE